MAVLADTLSPGKPPGECTGDWFLCMVTAGRGHMPGLLSDLQTNAADYYLPIKTVFKISKNGNPGPNNSYKRRTYQPLFPGYIFLNGDAAKTVAWESDHAWKIDDVARGMQKPLTEQLRAVEYRLAGDETFNVGPMFMAGSAVRIIYPHELAGTLGRVSGEDADGTVWVNIPLLNAGIPLSIAPELLEPVDDERQQQLTLNVCCTDCGRDTRNPSRLCDRCNGASR